MKLNGLELNRNQWIAFCQSLRVKASLTNLLDVRHNYWSFLMKFSNYCSDMVMDVVNSNSRNRSCWHWWAECHVERQALPSKWETRLTRMQFNANTCIFISIKHFQTHQHPRLPPFIQPETISSCLPHNMDEIPAVWQHKQLQANQMNANESNIKSCNWYMQIKIKIGWKAAASSDADAATQFLWQSTAPALSHPAHSITFPTPAGGTLG